MADEHYKWLNRETAERLLRGEPLDEAVDAAARDQAERLSEALGALSVQAAPTTGELPGEQAALAAFRKAREAAEAERTAAALADGSPGRRSAVPAPGVGEGTVRSGTRARTGTPARTRPRSGRPHWARPVRLALAAALAAGTLGGVAVAAGTGVLPVPFGGGRPGPASSTSTAQGPDRLLASTSPRATAGSGAPSGTPDAGTGGADRDGTGRTSGTHKGTGQSAGGADQGVSGAVKPSGTAGTWWRDAGAACRDIRDGKELDAVRRRSLESLAGGSTRVSSYCKALLAADDASAGASGKDSDKSGTGSDGGGKGDGNGQSGDDESHPGRRGDDKGRGGGKDRHLSGVAPTPSALAPSRHARTVDASPTPSPSRSSRTR
ncbi:hypothetical protein [Streptomyces sp. NK08204]|uniref:hypothetical protein n=1 Tax=Streptomyces sp. NK08204 TaxID=2873260 RepID=UPI001CEC2A2E|nr:hypothetical protein [Streptomyces sp. NK08204]